MALDESQKRFVLIEHARHAYRSIQGARKERLSFLGLYDALGVRNRVPVWIRVRAAQHFVHPIDEAIGDGVLEKLGLIVYLVPPQPHHLHEEEFDESMAAQDPRGEFFARARQGDAGVGRVLHEA
jgi:hypothetical protein